MSLDQAKKFIEVVSQDEGLKALFEKDRDAAIQTAGFDCTLAEIKEAYMLNRELDEEELNAVSGGLKAKGPGGCQHNYYFRACAATVEKGSWCGSNDWCDRWDEMYADEPGCGTYGEEYGFW